MKPTMDNKEQAKKGKKRNRKGRLEREYLRKQAGRSKKESQKRNVQRWCVEDCQHQERTPCFMATVAAGGLKLAEKELWKFHRDTSVSHEPRAVSICCVQVLQGKIYFNLFERNRGAAPGLLSTGKVHEAKIPTIGRQEIQFLTRLKCIENLLLILERTSLTSIAASPSNLPVVTHQEGCSFKANVMDIADLRKESGENLSNRLECWLGCNRRWAGVLKRLAAFTLVRSENRKHGGTTSSSAPRARTFRVSCKRTGLWKVCRFVSYILGCVELILFNLGRKLARPLLWRVTLLQASSSGIIASKAVHLLKPSYFVCILSRFGWTVQLENPDLDVWIRLTDSEMCIGVHALKQPSLQSGDVAFRGLNPQVCTAMVSAAAQSCEVGPCSAIEDEKKIDSGTKQESKTKIIVDCMCGTGAILCEAAKMYPAWTLVGLDINPKQLEAARANANAIGGRRINKAEEASQPSFLHCDSTKKENWPTWLLGSVDVVIADLPFGKQHGSLSNNKIIYPLVLSAAAAACKDNGRGVFLTNHNNTHLMPGQDSTGPWIVEKPVQRVMLGKMEAFLHIFQRRARVLGNTNEETRDDDTKHAQTCGPCAKPRSSGKATAHSKSLQSEQSRIRMSWKMARLAVRPPMLIICNVPPCLLRAGHT